MPPFALSPPHLWVGSCKDRPARRGGVRRRLLTWVRYTSPPSRSTDHTDDSLPNSPPSGPAPSARGLDAVHALQLLLGEFADLHPALSTLHGDTFGRRLGGYLGDVDRVTHGATGGRADGIGDEGEILVTELLGISAVQKACSHVLVEDS